MATSPKIITDSDTRLGHPPYIGIAITSLAALAYEILLIRLFSIIQFHHFISMVISLALLGYGASGTFFSLFREKCLARFSTIFLGSLACFAISMPLCFIAAQHIHFHPEAMIWHTKHIPALVLIYLLLSLPFFFAALPTIMALSRFTDRIGRLYSMDLLGAGSGGLVILTLLNFFFPQRALIILSSLVLIGGGYAAREMGRNKRLSLLFICCALLIHFCPQDWSALEISPYKELRQALEMKGTRVLSQKSGPLGLLTVVESSSVPWRHAPGLSLLSPTEPPPQLALFTDGGAMTTITGFDGDLNSLSYLDYLTSALPYHLRPIQKVLIPGAGGGNDLLQALYHHGKRIDAVELNPAITELVDKEFGDFSGNLYSRPNVHLHIAETRGYISTSSENHDLTQFVQIGSPGMSASSLQGMDTDYLYTTEALELYYRHLTPNGFLAISNRLNLPPRSSLKLFATALAAIKRTGESRPEDNILFIRGLQTFTLVLKKGPFTEKEIANGREFCRTRLFDLCYHKGIKASETNRFNRLSRPFYYEGATALAGERATSYMANYKFNLEPASDDKPFFYHFTKLTTLKEIFSLRGKGGESLIEWGYLTLILTFLQAIPCALLLILFPLTRLKRTQNASHPLIRLRLFVFFAAIGLAFLFLEISFIQRFTLFLHHPLYSTTLVISAFLVFAGLGAGRSQYFSKRFGTGPTIRVSIAILCICSISYLLLMGRLFSSFQGISMPGKALLSVLLIAPLGFCMGIPFPTALTLPARTDQQLLPWIWAVNGCCSVISAILATILAVHFGFTIVVLVALLLYVAAGSVFPELPKKT